MSASSHVRPRPGHSDALRERDITTIGGTGQYVIPGLWNNDVHSVSYDDAKAHLRDPILPGTDGSYGPGGSALHDHGEG